MAIRSRPVRLDTFLNARHGSITVLPVEKNLLADSCPIPDVCIDERRLPLFIARATLRELIAGLQARATEETAR